MTSVPISSFGRRLLAIAAIVALGPASTAGGQTIELLDTSFEVANHLEMHRALPDTVVLDGRSLDAAGYFHAAVASIIRLALRDTSIAIDGIWKMPDELYPEMVLDEHVYGHPLVQAEYVDFFRTLLDQYGDSATLASTFPLRGAEFRFVDAFYLASHVLRFYRTYGYLPTTVDPKLTSPNGLFPWRVPDDKLEYVGAIQNDEGRDYPRNNQFYERSVMDFDMYALAREILDDETDVYAAGEMVYFWVRNRYHSTPYGRASDVVDIIHNSYELIRNMQGTSDTPWRPKAGLYPAAAIPHGYGTFLHSVHEYGGAVYLEGHGWVNAEYHASFGAPANSSQYLTLPNGTPLPRDRHAIPLSQTHPVIEASSAIIQTQGETTTGRALWVNPADVEHFGAEEIVETAVSGGFNTVIVTGKSFMGRLYFDKGDAQDNTSYDAVAVLAPAVKTAGLKFLVALNTLSDYELDRASTWGQRYFESPVSGGLLYNEFYVSPCIAAYRGYLKHIIQSLLEGYDIDGLVFARNYVIYDAWNNPECNVAHTDEAEESFLAGYFNDLAGHAKSLQPTAEMHFLTAPLVAPNGNQVADETDDALPGSLNPTYFDGIILNVMGLSWLTDNFAYPNRSMEGLTNSLADYVGQTAIPLHISLHVSKEWQYPPEFYRGLARHFKTRGVDGVVLLSRNSLEGELGSAFVSQHYAKLAAIKFTSPPPSTDEMPTDVDQSVDQRGSAVIVSHTSYPNPFQGQTTIEYHLSERAHVRVSIFDYLGRTVATLTDADQSAGKHAVAWYGTNHRGRHVASGVYLYRLELDQMSRTGALILAR